MPSLSWKAAIGAGAWVLVVATLVGGGIATYRHQAAVLAQRGDLKRSVAETSAALNDFIDATVDAKSAITYKETFDLADEEIHRATGGSVKAQVVSIESEQRTALRSYFSDVANLTRLREQESRKALAYSGSNSAAEEAIAQARSANAYVADAYISSARRALGDMTKAATERATAEKDRRQFVKAFRSRLTKLRPSLSGYDIVTDAELAKLDPPDQGPPKAA